MSAIVQKLWRKTSRIALREHIAASTRSVFVLLVAALSVVAGPASARAKEPTDRCPADSALSQIEVLPFTHSASTCSPFSDSVHAYSGVKCRISAIDYYGRDAIYKVRLHTGHNNVVFRLHHIATPDHPAPDLVLALIRACTDDPKDGATCASSSDDAIGTKDEEMRAPTDPGIYYLYVDSVQKKEGGPDLCGSYSLTVDGFNPTPVLKLETPTVSSDPAFPGKQLSYRFTVSNQGKLGAHNVRIKQVLPQGVTFDTTNPVNKDCTASGGMADCGIGDLPIKDSKTRTIMVRVNPTTRADLKSTATAEADEGDPSAPQSMMTRIAVSDLELGMTASRATALAGALLTYTLTVDNHGPFAATNVKLTNVLPEKQSFVSFVSTSAPIACGAQGRVVTCMIDKVSKEIDAVISITVAVEPSARAPFVNHADVVADQSEPIPDGNPNSVDFKSTVTAETDLSITMSGPAQVFAGENLTYGITVHNGGPSDSSGVTVTDTLPGGVTFIHTGSNACQGDCCESNRTVTCTRVGSIPKDGDTPFTFAVHVDSGLKTDPRQPVSLSNKASVTGKEPEPRRAPGPNVSEPAVTGVIVQANLRVSMLAQRVADLFSKSALTAFAGENLLYTVTVTNCGPSKTYPSKLSDTLDPLFFVASPDGCSESGGTVTCPIPTLAPASICPPASPMSPESATVRYVVGVRADAVDSNSTLHVQEVASLTGEDDSPLENFSASAEVDVRHKADLAVALSGSPDPVDLGGDRKITYTLEVTNHGPSDATDLDIDLILPPDSSPVSPAGDCQEGIGVGSLGPFHLAILRSGDSELFTIEACTPAEGKSATATASVECPSTDPNCKNNTAEQTTVLATENQADLQLTKTTASEAVVAGDFVQYTIEVVNHGPGVATNVEVTDDLPEDVMFQSAVLGPGSAASNMACARGSGNVISCTFGPLAKNAKQAIVLNVQVTAAFAESRFANRAVARNLGSEPDPNLANNENTVAISVLHVAPLVLPFFKAGSNNVNTLLAVRNPSDDGICVRIDYFTSGQANLEKCDIRRLGEKGTLTRSLGDIFKESKEGFAGIAPIASEHCQADEPSCNPAVDTPILDPPPVPPLSGDFIRIEPPSHASGRLLVSTDTTRKPPELCSHWSVRFLNGGAFLGNTELFFFVPGDHPSGPVAVGKVYNEAGEFVQKISVTSADTAFRKTTLEGFDNGAPLLASFGSIEWQLREGFVGNVSAIHRNKDGYAVAVPGFCRKPSSAPQGSATLVVPYFEAEPHEGVTTNFAVRNESDSEVGVQYEYLSETGSQLLSQTKTLAPHGTRTINLRDPLFDPPSTLTGLQKGFVRVQTVGHQEVLSGDFVRIDPGSKLASGGALVSTPAQLCQKWSVRFLNGQPEGTTSDFAFYVDEATGGPVSGHVFSEAGGNAVGTIEVPADQTLLRAFQVHIPTLTTGGAAIPLNGTLEWDLGVKGNVASILKGNGLSVFLPGVCIQP